MNLLQTIKRFWWVALLVAGVQPAWGFALLGPLANGGDWQDSSLQATVVGDQNVVTVDPTVPTAPTGFFRLRGQ